MAREVVGKLTLIAAGSRTPPVQTTGLIGPLMVMVLKLWLNSRIAGIAVWLFCSAALVSAMWGSGATFAITVLAPVGLATLALLCPWLYVRWRFRCRHRHAVRAMEEVFSSERVTVAEWAEARRLIKQADPEFLRYGNGARLDHLCVP